MWHTFRIPAPSNHDIWEYEINIIEERGEVGDTKPDPDRGVCSFPVLISWESTLMWTKRFKSYTIFHPCQAVILSWPGFGIVQKGFNLRRKKMEDPKDQYLVEIFNLALVLYGELKELEEIKYFIIEEYHNKKLVKLLKPTYEKGKLVIVDEPEWRSCKRLKTKKSPDESDNFYFAAILRGEVKYLEEIRKYINQRPVEICESIYSKDRLFVVKESQWEQHKKQIQYGWYP